MSLQMHSPTFKPIFTNFVIFIYRSSFCFTLAPLSLNHFCTVNAAHILPKALCNKSRKPRDVAYSQVHTADFHRCDMRFLFSPVAAHSRLLSLLEAMSEALLREAFLCGCMRVIFQVFYWLSKVTWSTIFDVKHRTQQIFVFSLLQSKTNIKHA